jgi:hypothetical protein
VLLYFLHHSLAGVVHGRLFNLSLATVLTGLYILFILRIERKEFRKLPLLGRWMGGGPGGDEAEAAGAGIGVNQEPLR